MTFKKDYINYLLYSVVNSKGSPLRENYRLGKLVDSIMANDDVMKVTYLVGKTAGLELLFKYLLYISDKIDKSHVSIFNLKDNFEYDKKNLLKICENISDYKSENVQEAIKSITPEDKGEESAISEVQIELEPDDEIMETTVEEIESEGDSGNLYDIEDAEEVVLTEEGGTGLTLIENEDRDSGDAEVFELDSIIESVENSGLDNTVAAGDSDEEKPAEITSDISEGSAGSENNTGTENEDAEILNEDISEPGSITEEHSAPGEEPEETIEELPEIEIEVHKPMGASSSGEEAHVKEESITNEAYYKFETKFFEEVKILEKLFATVDRDCRNAETGKISEKCLQSLTEIIGITSELSSLSRQLSFDLIADIFLTMNIYFTKSISQPGIFTSERIKLLDSSLALVNSLIKGEDYLNYDTIVDRIENLKFDISQTAEPGAIEIEENPEEYTPGEREEIYRGKDMSSFDRGLSEKEDMEINDQEIVDESEEGTRLKQKSEEKYMEEESRQTVQKPDIMQSQIDSANFKLKYLIKEFEKIFLGINDLKGEYSKFDALEKIGELNNALRLIAKISAAIKLSDVLKLAEVTYVFLKYVKDYRMDLTEPEIQQIVKYIIFTFKMLVTNRKPEDFNVLVRHLNNPVKIFADS